MYEVFHTDRPEGPAALSNYYRTREEAEAHVASATGGRRDPVTGLPVELTGKDFLSIREIARESKPCIYCGGEVQSASADFCRACFYQGKSQESSVAELVAALKAHPKTDSDTVGVWHTGGGCFCVGAMIGDVEMLTAHEASVDELPSKQTPWGMSLSRDGEEYLNGDEDNLVSTAHIVSELDTLLARWEQGKRSL